jgi:Phage tail tube protein
MAFIHGKKTGFKVDNSAGSLTDLSGYTDDCTLARAVETGETTTYGQDDKTYITGLRDATFSASGSVDTASAATVDGVLSGVLGQDATVTVDYLPDNSQAVSSSNPHYTAECIVTKYDIHSPVDDVSEWSAEFQVSGGVTRATA